MADVAEPRSMKKLLLCVNKMEHLRIEFYRLAAQGSEDSRRENLGFHFSEANSGELIL